MRIDLVKRGTEFFSFSKFLYLSEFLNAYRLFIWLRFTLLSDNVKNWLKSDGQEGDMMKAVVYLELATRAGERAAAHVKNVILQQLSATSRDRAILLADTWRALPSSRWIVLWLLVHYLLFLPIYSSFSFYISFTFICDIKILLNIHKPHPIIPLQQHNK